MKPFRVLVACCALGVVAVTASPAPAAWNNVFQVSCFRKQTTANYYAAPAVAYSSPVVAAVPAQSGCCPQPQTTCNTSYVQRCYYQPVTSYQTQTYYEPVTTYQTKTYYEPVTTYRYSCYYDACSCSYQQVATPCTSYQARSQSCPVQSWVQRCCSVPVTTYQRSCYWEPQTSCCTAAAPAPAPAPCSSCSAGPTVTAVPTQPAEMQPPVIQQQQSAPQQPQINEQRYSTPPPPVINEQRSNNPSMYERYYGSSSAAPNYRQPPLSNPVPVPPASQTTPPPAVKLERMVQAIDTNVEGRIVKSDNAPRSGVQLVFVSAERQNAQQVVRANGDGQFQVTLTSGNWNVYVGNADGSRVYHSRIQVNDRQNTPYITLVSR